MSRYSNIEYVRRLSVKQGARLIAKAVEERRRDKVYLQYLAELPALKGGYSFEKYYQEVTRKVVMDERPMDELMEEIMKIKVD